MVQVHSDFYSDYIALLRKGLASFGLSLPASTPSMEVEFAFLNAIHRRIMPAARSVHESDIFSCPLEHQAGYAQLKTSIERGDDLTPHLSTRVAKTKYNDALLNDWGIQHLHLGIAVPGKRFVPRHGALLFAYFTQDGCYCIDVRAHDAWGDQALIDALLRNWPHLLQPFQLNGISADGPPLSAADRIKLRKSGIVPVTQVGETVFAPPGGGLSTSGLATKVVMEADWYRRRISAFEKSVREAAASQAEHWLLTKGRVLTAPVRLTFRFDDNGMVALDAHNGLRFSERWDIPLE